MCVCVWRFHGLTSSAVGHRSIASGFKTRLGYVRRVFAYTLCTKVAVNQQHLCICVCLYFPKVTIPFYELIDLGITLITWANCSDFSAPISCIYTNYNQI